MVTSLPIDHAVMGSIPWDFFCVGNLFHDMYELDVSCFIVLHPYSVLCCHRRALYSTDIGQERPSSCLRVHKRDPYKFLHTRHSNKLNKNIPLCQQNKIDGIILLLFYAPITLFGLDFPNQEATIFLR